MPSRQAKSGYNKINASRWPFRDDRVPVYAFCVTLSVVLITYNEAVNLARTLDSVMPLVRDGQGEIIVVDSGSTDRTVEIAKSYGAKVFVEPWKGYAGQKNSAVEKATGAWILSLDADEEVSHAAEQAISRMMGQDSDVHQATVGVWLARKNYFLGRWIKHGGFYPDKKLRLFRKGAGHFGDRAVHETVSVKGKTERSLEMNYRKVDEVALVHHSYPTLSDYIDHMNRYSSLGAEMVGADVNPAFSAVNIVMRPLATFIYNYFFRLGFLDGREGLLLHLYHSVYVSWKYAKAWELRKARTDSSVAKAVSE